MDFNNKQLKSTHLIIAVMVCAAMYFMGIFRIPALIVILIIIVGKNAAKAKPRTQQPPAQARPAEYKIPAASVCFTSNTDDEFCHNQHHAQRMTADAARSELQELKSLLESGMMEKPEYDQRVAELMAVLK